MRWGFSGGGIVRGLWVEGGDSYLIHLSLMGKNNLGKHRLDIISNYKKISKSVLFLLRKKSF